MKSTGSWGMRASFLLKSYRPMCAVLIPSMLMEPPANSTSRKSATPRDDFPKDNKWVWDTRQKAAAAAAVEQKNPVSSDLILYDPRCQWSPRAAQWKTGPLERAADPLGNASPHSGRWSSHAEASRGQERRRQDSAVRLRSPESVIKKPTLIYKSVRRKQSSDWYSVSVPLWD